MTKPSSRSSKVARLTAAVALAAAPAIIAAPVSFAAEAQQTVSGDSITVTDSGVGITVPSGVDPGQEITITGTGWQSTVGSGSTLVIKLHQLDDAGIDEMLTRTDGIINHPRNGNPDPTIWALTKAGDDGRFSLTTTLPDTLIPGQRFDIQVSSGLADDTDVRRSLKALEIPVGGVDWVDPNGGEAITCVPSTPSPTLTVDARPNQSSEVTITGTGFCHPTNGGSIVAFKIDDGKYKHVPGHLVNSNATVWGLTKTDPHTGDFTYVMRLPDGTDSGPFGSDPVFPLGVHTLRALTGSLKQGDLIRSLPSRNSHALDFVIGAYEPNAVPPPVGYERDVTPGTRYGVTAELGDDAITVTVPGAVEGDWFIPTLFLPDSSPIWPWGGRWFRTNDRAEFVLPITEEVHIPAGKLKLVLQSGNEGVQGTLMGWTPLDIAEAINPRGGDTAVDTPAEPKKKQADPPLATDGPGFFYTNQDSLFQLVDNIGTVAKKTDTTVDLVDAVFGIGATGPADTAADDTTGAPTTQAAAAPAVGQQSAPPTDTVVTVIKKTVTREIPADTPGWSDTPRPDSPPNNQPTSEADLVDANKGPVTASVVGDAMTIVVTGQSPGSWVYVSAFVNGLAHDIGFAQLDGNKSFVLDISSLPDGEHAIALTTESGFVGWAPLTRGTPTGTQPHTPTQQAAAATTTPNDTTVPAAQVTAAAAPVVGITDWLLIVGAAVVTGLGAVVVRRRVATA
ncbi:hypothetical protein ACFSSC_10185 [Corynebacterium mendelii]|uniref:Uncharacterized protein n=1 Tax=Corynebacterium mendelii TaxID=2765362 RepID=A0A939E251_9CORY|nr:hypothetical protein [Corynebacterium mendelii]MBN9644388.1 hypothetical protein [Corynebacterium mendelii]